MAILPGYCAEDSSFYGRIFIGSAGSGEMYVPYKNSSNDQFQEKKSEKKSDYNGINTAAGNRYSFGYFYGLFQIEAGYFHSSIEEQSFRTYTGKEKSLHSTLSYYDARGGLRLSNTGSTSFQWIHFGARDMKYSASYKDTEAKGLGYSAGYTGWLTLGISDNFDIVGLCEFFYGVYRKNSISWNENFNVETRQSRFMNLSLGAGLQYDPYNLSIILKVCGEKNYISHRGTGGKIAAGADELIFGFEIIYFNNRYRNN